MILVVLLYSEGFWTFPKTSEDQIDFNLFITKFLIKAWLFVFIGGFQFSAYEYVCTWS